MNRRQFLGTTAAAAMASAAPFSPSSSAQSGQSTPVKKLPIGVFDPPFNKLSLDEMLDKFVSLGIEAVEVGAAGPNGSPHCPRPELVADPAKARAWKKKFDDRGIPVMTLSCHNNALYPDAAKAKEATDQFRQTIQLAGMLEIPTVVGFSGCPGGSATDTVPNWVIYDWPPEHGAALQWQWKERVIPYWQETAKFAREHGVHRIAPRDASELCGLQSAHAHASARGGGGGDRRQLRFEPSFLAAMQCGGGHPFSRQAGSDLSRAHERHGLLPPECRPLWRLEFRQEG